MTFNYVAAVDFKLPEKLLGELSAVKTTPTEHFAILPQQVFALYSSGTELSFPITLKEGENDCVVTKEMFDDLSSRFGNILDYMGGNFSSFCLNRVPEILEKKVIFYLPKVLQEHVDVVTVFEVGTDGAGLKPHRDYRRKCTLWYMFEGEQGHETLWFHTTDKHNPDAPYIKSVPNIEHLTEAYRTTLKKNQWYVFDNDLYHAVRSGPHAEVRRVLTIEFFDIFAKDLYNKLTMRA